MKEWINVVGGIKLVEIKIGNIRFQRIRGTTLRGAFLIIIVVSFASSIIVRSCVFVLAVAVRFKLANTL